MEGMLEKHIENNSTLIQMGSFMKTAKTSFIVIVLAFNSGMNDFFICYFFFATSIMGWWYLSMCGFEKPTNTGAADFANGRHRTVKQHE